jgi:hypothetical protein
MRVDSYGDEVAIEEHMNSDDLCGNRHLEPLWQRGYLKTAKGID